MLAMIALSAIGFLRPFESEAAPPTDTRIRISSVVGIFGEHCKAKHLERIQSALWKLADSVPLQKFHCICRGLTRSETVADAEQFRFGHMTVPTQRRFLGGDDILLSRPYRFARQWPTKGDPRTTEIIIWAIDEGKSRVLTEFFIGHAGLRDPRVIFDGYLLPYDAFGLTNGSCSG
jgi:hypothetical protein